MEGSSMHALGDGRLPHFEGGEQGHRPRSSLQRYHKDDTLSYLGANEQSQRDFFIKENISKGWWTPPLEEGEERLHPRFSLQAYNEDAALFSLQVGEQGQHTRSSLQTYLEDGTLSYLGENEQRQRDNYSMQKSQSGERHRHLERPRTSLQTYLEEDTLSSLVNDQRQRDRSSLQTSLRDDIIFPLHVGEQRQHRRPTLHAYHEEDTFASLGVNEQRQRDRSSLQTPLRDDELHPLEVTEQRQTAGSSTQQLEDANSSSKNKRPTRGRTTLKAVVPMNGQKHKCFVLEDGRVVGPGRRKLSNLLGILARNHCLFPIHKEWGVEHESKIDKVMADVHRDFEFFNLDGTKLISYDDVTSFVKKTINQQLRDFRAMLKSKLDPDIPITEQVQALDNRVPPDFWLSLIELWSKEEKMLEASRNKKNRSVIHATHTSGSTSFGEKQYKAMKDGVPLPIIATYVNCHKRKNGEYLSEKMKEICEKVEQRSRELGGDKAEEPLQFVSIIDDAHGSHHGGYERGISGGVTRRSLKRKKLTEESNKIATIAWTSQLQEKDHQIKEKDHQLKEKDRELEDLRAEMRLLLSQVKSFETGCHVTPQSLDGRHFNSQINVDTNSDWDGENGPLTCSNAQNLSTHLQASGTRKRVMGPNVGT